MLIQHTNHYANASVTRKRKRKNINQNNKFKNKIMQLKSYRGIDQKVLSLVARVLVICHNRVGSVFKSITLRI